MEDRRIRRELQETFLKLSEISVQTSLTEDSPTTLSIVFSEVSDSQVKAQETARNEKILTSNTHEETKDTSTYEVG